MPFLKEPEPTRGVPLDVLPRIRRIVARNLSVMTYWGTNTYLIEGDNGVAVIDPGPNDAQHVRDILSACDISSIKQIILTHAHSDHCGAVAELKEASGAAVYGCKIAVKKTFASDIDLNDGDTVAGLKALFTPGHAADHVCFEFRTSDASKILFSGDHVMSWSSSIVSPPEGNMLQYYHSLELLLRRDEDLYLPGHGPTLSQPRELVQELLTHRQRREASILKQVETQPWNVAELAAKLYHKADPKLKIAAQKNVLAHLLKLQTEGIVFEMQPENRTGSALPLDLSVIKEIEQEGELATEIKAEGLRRFALRKTGKHA